MRISVSIITKNAMPRLRETLESVKWADEIIVLDSGSSDDTVEVAKEYTDKVFETDWPGFGVQKQRGLDKCGGDWLISIDADEVVTPVLKEEILTAINNAPKGVNGFEFPRLSFLCNQPVHHSGWRPDYVLRVFRKGFVQYSPDLVHERPVIEGKTNKLSNDLIHYSYDSVDSLIQKANSYSTLGAQQLYDRGKKATITKAVFKGVWAFIRTYFLRRGILDGKHGLLIAVANTEATFYKYAKLAMMHHEAKKSQH